MSDHENKGMSSSEVAYRMVLENQAASERANSAFTPDVSNTQSTPLIVWGALFGLVVGAFSGGSHSILASIGIMLASMFICAGIVWGIGKAFRLFFGTAAAPSNVTDGEIETTAGALTRKRAVERSALWRRRLKFGATFGTIAAILLAVSGEPAGGVVFGFFVFGLIGALLSRFLVRKPKVTPRTPEAGPPPGEGWTQGR